MDTIRPSLFLEAAFVSNDSQHLAAVLRFFTDFLPSFKNTFDHNRYCRILNEMNSSTNVWEVKKKGINFESLSLGFLVQPCRLSRYLWHPVSIRYGIDLVIVSCCMLNKCLPSKISFRCSDLNEILLIEINCVCGCTVA